LTITAPNGYVLSTSQNGTYNSTLQYPYSLGTINLTNFYVKFKPTVVGSYNDSLVISNGTKTRKIALSGQCVVLTGQNASVYWELSAAPAAPVTQGPINVIPQTYNNMILSSYAATGSTQVWSGVATTSWTGVALNVSTKTQRNVVVGTTWPSGDIDIVNSRYIQFGVNAIQGTVFDIDSIGLYGGGAGGSGMRFKVYISKDSLFSNPDVTTMIGDRGTIANTSNTMYPITYNKLTELAAGESLYLRIYPWYNGTASGKTMCLYGVLIKGVVSPFSAISTVRSSALGAYCYPAQTRDKTILKYTLKKKTDIRISIQSIDGRTITCLEKKSQLPDNYEQEINLTSMPSGLYLCSIMSGFDHQTLKVVKE
jgi:hypothetical protein